MSRERCLCVTSSLSFAPFRGWKQGRVFLKGEIRQCVTSGRSCSFQSLCVAAFVPLSVPSGLPALGGC